MFLWQRVRSHLAKTTGRLDATLGMSQSDPYPRSVQELLDDRMTFKPSALRAVRAFARARPWQGTLDDRHQKFRQLHNDLCAAYGLDPKPQLVFGNDHTTDSGSSCFIPAMNTIVLRGRMSVVTYLHEFAHARGRNEREAARWSINLFRRCFPKSWGHVRFDGHMIRSTE
ncbi:MAG TPA: hypothetical protein VK324_00145 [Tepidisphaeraceae bacterium]|nr:hypothetical protein [Tepidisphaeraceae bacterium]